MFSSPVSTLIIAAASYTGSKMVSSLVASGFGEIGATSLKPVGFRAKPHKFQGSSRFAF